MIPEQQTIPGIPVPRRKYRRSPLRQIGERIRRVIASADEIERSRPRRLGGDARGYYTVSLRVTVRDKETANDLEDLIIEALKKSADGAKTRARQIVIESAHPERGQV